MQDSEALTPPLEASWAPDAYGGRHIPKNPWGSEGRTAQFQAQAVALIANQRTEVRVDFEPEYWHVAVLPTPSASPVVVAVAAGESVSGSALPLGGGGRVKNLPANVNTPALALWNMSGNPATVVVIAVYGNKDFDYQPGTLPG